VSNQIMLVNASAGDECRIAVLEDGKLEELYSERTSAQSHVGNVYVGKVTNVEAAIQAAFVDFGTGRNGFLHISDLHPMYFPGETKETTERVGKKTPRRDRPPMQQALRRGQEILVQVLKDGIGTKGPTLTSYISIPGRYLVMMPFMERLGVSRRVEDEDQRRDMRKVLDTLDVPEGFGFIMRTAGLGQTKTELKRDLAFLQRLWKDMQRRKNRSSGKALELYSESDLLIRTIRDVVSKDISRIVVDDISALKRIDRFLSVVAPRSGPDLAYYDRETPLFHSFGVEQQISDIRSPVAPLPSGGYLVIEQTEALVAIDVNSGKSRSSRDAETNAYKTNMEAVKEISRQLRLRDLGGLVINDLIDMTQRKHQSAVENAFRGYLKKDRARTKILRTSQFGIIEMTRQRMRGGIQSAQHKPCPHCEGTGHLKNAETVSLDLMRSVTALLDQKAVQTVEVSVGRQVANEVISKQRYDLCLLEQRTGKKVQVRVSEDIAPDRVDFYAYDDRGADLNLEHLHPPKPPEDLPVLRRGEIEELEEEHQQLLKDELAEQKQELLEEIEAAHSETEQATEEPTKKKRRRRRRRRRKSSEATEGSAEETPEGEEQPPQEETAPAEEAPQGEEQEGEDEAPKKRRRRRGRRGGRRAKVETQTDSGDADEPAESEPEPGAETEAPAADEERPTEGTTGRKRRRRRRGRKRSDTQAGEEQAPLEVAVETKPETEPVAHVEEAPAAEPEAPAEVEEVVKKKRRTRKKTTKKVAAEKPTPDEPAAEESKPAVTKKKTTKKKTTRKPTAKKTTKKVTKKTTKKKTTRKKTATEPKADDAPAADKNADSSADSKKLPKRRSIRATTRRTKKTAVTAGVDRDDE
jgi:ribonuclease E